ncbi:Uncharacterised protein [Klebsiella oxytoca]|nr:Uncharacterised protein [Klebsiella oxytoca]
MSGKRAGSLIRIQEQCGVLDVKKGGFHLLLNWNYGNALLIN